MIILKNYDWFLHSLSEDDSIIQNIKSLIYSTDLNNVQLGVQILENADYIDVDIRNSLLEDGRKILKYVEDGLLDFQYMRFTTAKEYGISKSIFNDVLPDFFSNYDFKSVYIFSSNKINTFPDWFVDQNNLTKLLVSANNGFELKNLPKNILSLNFSDRNVKKLSDEIIDLKNVEEIDIFGGNISIELDLFSNMKKLKNLSLYGDNVSSSKGLNKLTSLSEILLANMEVDLKTFHNICCAPNLRIININGGNIEDIPDNIVELSKLIQLNIGDCEGIPVESYHKLSKMDNLKRLEIPKKLKNYLPTSLLPANAKIIYL